MHSFCSILIQLWSFQFWRVKNWSKFERKIFPSHICPKLCSYWQKTCCWCRRNFKFGTQADFFMLRKKPQNNFFLRGQQHCENGIWNIKIFASIFLLSHNILHDEENHEKYLYISDPIFTMLLAPEKKVILEFFFEHKLICLCPEFELEDSSNRFFANNCLILDKYLIGIFFLQILSSFSPVSAGIIIFWSKLCKNWAFTFKNFWNL